MLRQLKLAVLAAMASCAVTGATAATTDAQRELAGSFVSKKNYSASYGARGGGRMATQIDGRVRPTWDNECILCAPADEPVT